jgi:hypothetical protein
MVLYIASDPVNSAAKKNATTETPMGMYHAILVVFAIYTVKEKLELKDHRHHQETNNHYK